MIEQIVNTPQTQIYTYQMGDKKNTPFLIFPSLFSNIKNWQQIMTFFSKRFFVTFFDLPGHGKSLEYTDGYSYTKLMDDIDNLMQSLSSRTFHVMGFSYGGFLALQTLRAYPERISSVILAAPFITPQTLALPTKKLKQAKTLHTILASKPIKKRIYTMAQKDKSVIRLIKLARFIGLLKNEEISFYQKQMAGMDEDTVDTIANQLKECITQTLDFAPKHITQPIHLVMTKKDPIVDYEKTLQTLMSWAKKRIHITTIPDLCHTHVRPIEYNNVERIYSDIFHKL